VPGDWRECSYKAAVAIVVELQTAANSDRLLVVAVVVVVVEVVASVDVVKQLQNAVEFVQCPCWPYTIVALWLDQLVLHKSFHASFAFEVKSNADDVNDDVTFELADEEGRLNTCLDLALHRKPLRSVVACMPEY
jgi:hypothetical protein